MGAAFEVNRQMCDIGRLISVEEMAERYNKQILQSRLDGLSAWLKLQDMEEKKTKKMTKAEAFEYLKGKKILVDCHPNVILKKLFDIGLKWATGDTEIGDWCELEMYGLVNQDKGLVWYHQYTTDSKIKFESLDSEKIIASDILSIEIVEDTKPDCERNEHVKALQEFIAKSGCIDCIIISKNDIGILKK